MRQPSVPGMAPFLRPTGAIAALFAIATALMLQSVRVFVSYLVFVVDQSQRASIATIAIVVFAFPLSCWVLVRLAGTQRLLAAAVLLLAAARLCMQLVEQPVFRLVSGGTVIIAWGVLTVLLISASRRPVVVGLILGFAIDLSLRTLRGSLDVVWMPGAFQTVQVILAIALLVSLWWFWRDSVADNGAGWRSATALVTIGPALALYHLVTGNPAFVSAHTGLSASSASAVLAGGLLLGTVIGVLRLIVITLGGGDGALVTRFILFDVLIGGAALFLAWDGNGLAAFGAFFATVAATELLLFALAADDEGPNLTIGPIAAVLTIGVLIHFAILFVYYISTGSGLMIAIAWVGLVVGTLITVLALPGSLRRQQLELRSYGLPAIAVVLLLVVSVGWATTIRDEPEPQPGDAATVSVITYNIQSGFSLNNRWDLEATAQVIEDADADIVVLQEVSRGWLVTSGNDQLDWLSKRLDMPYVWGPASTDDLWGNAVLSRLPVVSESLTRYAATQNLKRSALTVGLEVRDGFILTVVATHLDNPAEADGPRSAQLEQLVGILAIDRPTIVAGDFNMTPDDPLIERLIDTGLVDTAAEAGALDGTSEDGRRIDFIFASPEIAVLSAEVIDSDASDHRPVVATLELP